MDVIRHKTIRTDLDCIFGTDLPQYGEEDAEIMFVEKNRKAAVPALHDMMRTTRNDDSCHPCQCFLPDFPSDLPTWGLSKRFQNHRKSI